MYVAQCMIDSLRFMWTHHFFKFIMVMNNLEEDDHTPRFEEQLNNIKGFYEMCNANAGRDFWFHLFVIEVERHNMLQSQNQ